MAVRPRAAAAGRGRGGVGPRDADRGAGTAPDGGLAVGDRVARGADLGERAVLRAVPAGHLAAQDLGTRPAERLGGGRPEESLPGRVQSDDTVLGIDLEDEVGGTVDDRAELVPLVLERLAQPGAGERDGELVTREEGDPEAVVVERAARWRPDGEEHRGLRFRQGDGSAAGDRRRPRPAPRRGPSSRCRGAVRGRGAALRPDPIEPHRPTPTGGRARRRPRRPGGRAPAARRPRAARRCRPTRRAG